MTSKLFLMSFSVTPLATLLSVKPAVLLGMAGCGTFSAACSPFLSLPVSF